jgi:large subunit GTPase 1
MTSGLLDRQEKDAFLEWRRGLAECVRVLCPFPPTAYFHNVLRLQETEGFLLTPFERNIEVWRQLWRVLERSHLIVQIVDARNPLRFRCEDLEDYIRDVEGPEGETGTGKGKRKSLLLINKADLLTAQQRCVSAYLTSYLPHNFPASCRWADYFDSRGILYAFFSAANAAALQEARQVALETGRRQETEARPKVDEPAEADGSPEPDSTDREQIPTSPESEEDVEDESDEESMTEEDYFSAEEDEFNQDPRAQILSVLELEDLFLKEAPPLSGERAIFFSFPLSNKL